MFLFYPEMKMAEVVHYNYLLIPVIRRFGIKLGFGDKSVYEICKEMGIDTDFFLTILNTYSNKDYFPEKRLKNFTVIEFVKYLRKTHDYYLGVLVPKIEGHIDALIKLCKKDCKSIELIKKFFLIYKKELIDHISREEKYTFPYVEKIIYLHDNTCDHKEFTELSSKYSMKKFSEEHDDIDEKLNDLKNILIKYVHGDYDEGLTNSVISELFRLEQDLKDHARLEDKVLLPVVVKIEKSLSAHVS